MPFHRLGALAASASLLAAACSGSDSPTSPSVVAAQSVISTPAPAPPQPTVTNFAGTWTGTYVVDHCSGSSGSMGDVLCSAPRPGNSGGIFQPGVGFPISLELTQTGSAVNGVLAVSQISGPVNGSVRANQSLNVQGTVTTNLPGTPTVITMAVTNWDSSISNGTMTGTAAMSILINAYPGDGVISIRMLNLRR